MELLLARMEHNIIGVDLSKGMMDVGRRKADEQNLSMTFTNSDAEDVPFADETLDVIVNRPPLWTLPGPDKTLASWSRVRKQKGNLLVIDSAGMMIPLSRSRRNISISTAMREKVVASISHLNNYVTKNFVIREIVPIN